MKYIVLSLMLFVSGCSYPKYQMQKLDELSVNNKRHGNKAIEIREFINPGDTEKAFGQIKWKNFCSDTEKNTILNVLYYTQNIKQTNELKDFWQYPRETIEKGGDCEDKTFLLLSMLIKAGINDVQGVKGRFYGQGHMWVEYKGYILDPYRKTTGLIPLNESKGYLPHFKFDQDNIYFCKIERGN